jgi:hypothetical protein
MKHVYHHMQQHIERINFITYIIIAIIIIISIELSTNICKIFSQHLTNTVFNMNHLLLLIAYIELIRTTG